MNAIHGSGAGTLADLVRALAQKWLPGVDLDPRQARRLRRAVLRIGGAQGVIDTMDRAPVDAGTLPYQACVIEGRIAAVLAQGAGLTPPDTPRFGTVSTGAALLPGVVPAALVRAVDVNAATANELAALPGLGPVSARRLVARRAAHGAFTEFDDIRQGAGIAGRAFDRARPFLFLGTGALAAVRSVAMERLRTGGMQSFLSAWSEGALRVPHLDGLDPTEAMVTQVEHCAKSAHAAPAVPRLWAPSRRRLNEGTRALRQGAAIADAAHRDSPRVAPVFSAGYLPLLLNLIAAAETEIAASLFYFTVGDPDVDGDPGDRVVDALVAAQDRGVQIRLILDDDLAPDLHGARLVNDSVFQVLDERGLAFRRDHYEVSSHAKMIVVDRARALVGSHNWTASAFFRYQETSLLVESAGFAEQVAQTLDRRWALLAPPESRIVPVETLESLSKEERSALVDEGLEDGPELLQATRLKAQTVSLSAVTGISEARLDRTRRIVNLMQSFRISETLGFALVADGLDAPSEVARAGEPRLQRAFLSLKHLPPPFTYRGILPETAEWLADQEVRDG